MMNRWHVLLPTILQLSVASQVRSIPDTLFTDLVKLVTAIRLERNISKTTWARDFKIGMQLCIGNNERAHK